MFGPIRTGIRRVAGWAMGDQTARLEAALRQTLAERDAHVEHQRLIQTRCDELLRENDRLREAARQSETIRDQAVAARLVIEREFVTERERHYHNLRQAAGPGGGYPQQSEVELLESLRRAGVQANAVDPVTFHVGFGHAATTSLQQAFFAHRDDIFYLGTPYQDAGGFFTWLKTFEDYRLDPVEMFRHCQENVYAHPKRAGRPIVVSDELFTEPAEVYYDPRPLPGDLVAWRLKRFFPTARIVFTIRNQTDYVQSLYFNLKRNYSYLAGMGLPPFDEWWQGRMHQQARGTQLVNLDYAPLVRVYVDLFGRDRVLVLPLEELKTQGEAAYLGRLGDFMGLPIRPEDVERFRTPRNGRMSVVEERVAELLAARQHDAIVREAMKQQALAELIPHAPRAALELGEQVCEVIRRHVEMGNRWLAEAFHLPLAEYGYFV